MRFYQMRLATQNQHQKQPEDLCTATKLANTALKLAQNPHL